jgi:hypothetical protein
MYEINAEIEVGIFSFQLPFLEPLANMEMDVAGPVFDRRLCVDFTIYVGTILAAAVGIVVGVMKGSIPSSTTYNPLT